MGKNHSYTYDVFYEGLNKISIASQGGDFFSGYVSALLRYQLAGYAWGKALLENPNFLIDFNRLLFSQAASDPATLSTEYKLVAIAAAAQPAVEGKGFTRWYNQQFVLNTSPPRGYFLYNRLNQFTIDFFLRGADGREMMLPGEPVGHAVFDSRGTLLDSGTDTTTAYGLMMYTPSLPVSYTGRIQILATATTPEGAPVSDAVFGYTGPQSGVFGMISDKDFGRVEVIPLDMAIPPGEAEVINGGFSIPSMTGVKGRLLATFIDPAGRIYSKQFTKDASDYYLPLSAGSASVDLAITQSASTKKQKSGLIVTYNLLIRNLSPTTVTDVVLVDRLPTAGSLLSVTASAGTYSIAPVSVNGILTLNLDSLAPGSTASVSIAVGLVADIPSSLANTANIYAASVDANPANNSSLVSLGLK
jgi:uncharacterized repeat protein (TIGR01451 family)